MDRTIPRPALGVRIFQAAHNLSWDMHAESHDEHELVYILRGPYRVCLGKETLSGKAGDVFYYPAGYAHTPDTPQDLTTVVLVLRWTDKDAKWRAPAPFHVHDYQGRLLVALNWLRDTRTGKTKDRRAQHRALLTALLLETDELRGQAGASHDPLCYVEESMRRVPEHPFGLNELAAGLGLNPFTLIRRFRRRFGVTPMQYLQKVRLEKAVNLLHSTPMTLKELAQRVGYAQATYLHFLIKREYGRSPSQLRGVPRSPSRPRSRNQP